MVRLVLRPAGFPTAGRHPTPIHQTPIHPTPIEATPIHQTTDRRPTLRHLTATPRTERRRTVRHWTGRHWTGRRRIDHRRACRPTASAVGSPAVLGEALDQGGGEARQPFGTAEGAEPFGALPLHPDRCTGRR